MPPNAPAASASVTAIRPQRASDALAKAGAAIEDPDHMRPSRFRLCARVGSATKPRKRKVRVALGLTFPLTLLGRADEVIE
jgi:hypothetical protein